jgi:hypothetical protein
MSDKGPEKTPLSGPLRRAVASAQLIISTNGISRLAEQDAGTVAYFANNVGKMSLASADKVAAALGVYAAGSSDADWRQPLSGPLKRAVAASGLPLGEVARRARVASGHLSKFMRGQVGISLASADALASIFQVSAAGQGWLDEVAREAARLDRSASWVIQRAWTIAREASK